MYNEEIKKRYLEEKKNENSNIEVFGTRQFEQIADFEKQLNKDCCEFTISEIIDCFKRKYSVSMESLAVIKSLFASYTDWCLKKNMVRDNQNHYYEVSSEIERICLNNGRLMDMIISREELIYMIKKIENISDRALLLAMFEGICGKSYSELVNLHCENIEGYQVKLYTGRSFTISDELKKYCEISQNTYERVLSNGVVMPLQKCDTGVFKNLVAKGNKPIGRKPLYNRLVDIREDNDLTFLTSRTLKESGRIYMLKNIMKTEGMTLDEALGSRKTEYRYGHIQNFKNWKLKYEEFVQAV